MNWLRHTIAEVGQACGFGWRRYTTLAIPEGMKVTIVKDEAARDNVRVFATGAYRDTSHRKPSFLRHLSPRVLRRYVEFLDKAQNMPDGSRREPDNWKLGMPKREWAESLMRHTWDFWEATEEPPPGPGNLEDVEEMLCAILFNAQGYLNELLKERERRS